MSETKEFKLIQGFIKKEILTGVDLGLRRAVEKLFSAFDAKCAEAETLIRIIARDQKFWDADRSDLEAKNAALVESMNKVYELTTNDHDWLTVCRKKDDMIDMELKKHRGGV